MPSWCSTRAVIYGDEKDVKAIKAFIEQSLKEAPRKDASNPHNWLGQIVIAASGSADNCSCRGWVQDISDIETDKKVGSYFFIDSEDAWGPILPDVIDHLIFHKFPESSLQMNYIAEEPSCEVYVNTDTSGLFFPESYLLIDDDDYHYFENESELYKFLQGTCNCKCTTLDEVKAWAANNEACYFYEFEKD